MLSSRARSEIESTNSNTKMKRNSHREVHELSNVDHVCHKRKTFSIRSSVVHFLNNEAVIKMIIKGRSPTMRHVSRIHRVALEWLFDFIYLDPKIHVKYVDTKNQLTDMLANKKWSNCSKFEAFVWMIVNSCRKNLNQLEKLSIECSQIVLKCSKLARIGRPDILWSVNKLARSVTKWTQHVTDDWHD